MISLGMGLGLNHRAGGGSVVVRTAEDVLLESAMYYNAEDLGDGAVPSWTSRSGGLAATKVTHPGQLADGNHEPSSYVTSGVIDWSGGNGSVDTRYTPPAFDQSFTIVERSLVTGFGGSAMMATANSASSPGVTYNFFSADSYATDYRHRAQVGDDGGANGDSFVTQAVNTWNTHWFEYDHPNEQYRMVHHDGTTETVGSWQSTSGRTFTAHGYNLRLGARGDGFGATSSIKQKYVAVFESLLTGNDRALVGGYDGVTA